MGSTPENYQTEVPDGVDKSKEEWLELSYHAQYYHANESRQDKLREGNQRRRKERREWLREIKSERGCNDCDEDDERCLDFHHVGEKNHNVSRMANNVLSKERICEEIENCIVLCANCHRKHHRKI